jgi:hypothetical protein
VRGRLASTLPCSRALSGLGPVASPSVIATSLLKPAAETSWRVRFSPLSDRRARRGRSPQDRASRAPNR